MVIATIQPVTNTEILWEFMRNNRELAFGLTGQQFASVALFIAMVIYFVMNREKLFVTAQTA